MAEQQMSQKEHAEILKIATDYCRENTQSEEEANRMMNGIAKLITTDSAKLIHLGNVLFLAIVRGAGTIEIHTIGKEDDPRDLAKDFQKLASYLKNLGVKTAYTYTQDTRFRRIFKMSGLHAKQLNIKIEGKPALAYVMEM